VEALYYHFCHCFAKLSKFSENDKKVILTTLATVCTVQWLQCIKFSFGCGCTLDLTGGCHSAPQTPWLIWPLCSGEQKRWPLTWWYDGAAHSLAYSDAGANVSRAFIGAACAFWISCAAVSDVLTALQEVQHSLQGRRSVARQVKLTGLVTRGTVTIIILYKILVITHLQENLLVDVKV